MKILPKLTNNIRKCNECSLILTLNNCSQKRFDKHVYKCNACFNKRCKESRIKHDSKQRRENRNKKNKERDFKIKLDVIKNYGGSCVCCGIIHPDFLTIDHINNNGYIDRKENNRSGDKMYKWLKKNNYPKDNYQLLCYNCNLSKAHVGYCPHNII